MPLANKFAKDSAMLRGKLFSLLSIASAKALTCYCILITSIAISKA
jgi:hypothetical protein